MTSRITKKIERFTQSLFLRDALSLAGGTAIAQLISLVTLPILSRMYPPAAFGEFAIFMTTAAITVPLVSLKLEQMVLLPESDKESASILLFIVAVGIISSIIIFVALVLLRGMVIRYPDFRLPGYWIALFPPVLFFMGLYQGLRFWTIRHKNFVMVSLSLIGAVLGGAIVSIVVSDAFGGEVMGVPGLVVGYFFQQMLGAVILMIGLKKYHGVFHGIRWNRIYKSTSAYKKLTLSLIISDWLSKLSQQAPTYVIGVMFGNGVLGLYSMAVRLTAAPTMLIANALGDVYRQRAAREFNNRRRFDSIFRKTLFLTTISGLPIFAVFIYFSPMLFVWMLGPEWVLAGEYAQILLVAGLASFITTPLDKGAVIVGASRFILGWNIARASSVLGVLIAGIYMRMSVMEILVLLASARVVLYLVNLRYEYMFSMGNTSV